ncbi:hypothetical protein Glove_79g25 [Diversispora epigaea]|uniref:Protein kinase domain-containing protein n=1 Tax=Diversispora epigaea TaxID=1348612 RepID=A0A397JHD3_9GLOM|nr:hypothetical protein Glove_79g25 [Diversispora epigaea]
MSFSNSKDLTRIAEDRKIKKFDYNTFEDIQPIASGGFGSVNRAYSKDLKKQVALKCLHDENSDNFYKAFMNELQNIIAVNHHKNIVKYYGVSIDHSVEKCYLVLQYAKDDNLRNYLRDNFKDLNWKTKIKMAQDITNDALERLYLIPDDIHKSNIVHRDLHSKNVLVHEKRLLITDLGLSKSLDANSNSFAGGMCAYSDPEYLRNPKTYKRSKASDIYSLGVLFWELSWGRPPFYKQIDFEIYNLIISGKREPPINGTPEDYIKIYSDAWKDNPNQRPTIEEICDSLENIQFESIHNNFNENNQYIQIEVYNNNQLNNFKSISKEAYSRDPDSSNQISFGNSINQKNLEITVLGNPTLSPNSYDQEWFNNELKKYGYNDFENLKEIGDNVHNATLKNDEKKVTLKSIIVDSMELFVNELKKHLEVDSHENIIKFYGISQKDLNSSNYILVFEYSNETLRNYLKFNFEKLEWPNKLKLAQQIAKAIKYFHSLDIIHGDLLKKHLEVDSHENIIKFYGISQKDLNSSNYILVFEYSNETLRNYLKFNFEKLEWPNKLKLAQQIAKAIKYFHSLDIIHGDLNSENILIHNNIIKISNFGISKLVIEPSIDLLNSFRLIEYSDPILLKAEGKFSRTKASDIYSVGILLWEISSGKFPYYSYESRLQARETMEANDESRLKDKFSSKDGCRSKSILEKIVSYIIKGNREIPVQGTPKNYVDIYQDCWNQDPEQRPNIEKVIQELEHVASIK